MKKETKKIIDFRNIEIKDLEGKIVKFDPSKLFGNYIYKSTGDLGVFEVARKIYNDGQVELTQEISKELVLLLKSPHCPLVALLKVRLLEMIEEREEKSKVEKI